MSPCFNSDASRHNYFPQSAVVMTWVNRVNKCGDKDERHILSPSFNGDISVRVSAGPTGVRVTCFFMLELRISVLS